MIFRNREGISFLCQTIDTHKRLQTFFFLGKYKDLLAVARQQSQMAQLRRAPLFSYIIVKFGRLVGDKIVEYREYQREP